MADATALRQTLAAFLGDAQYRKFVEQGVHRGRMRYWQEEAWARFTDAHPEFAVGPDELAAALRVCHLHGDELQPGTAEVFHGNMDLARWYVEARNRLFPHAAQDMVSTEGRPFEGDRIGVWFCPSCRAARAEWESRRQARAELVAGYEQRYKALQMEFDQALAQAKSRAAEGPEGGGTAEPSAAPDPPSKPGGQVS